MKNKNSELIEEYKKIHPIKVGRIEIYGEDFPIKLNWNESLELAEIMGDGWRLPNSSEGRYFISLFKLGIGKFENKNPDRRGYWTNEKFSTDTNQLMSGIYIDFEGVYGYNIVSPCLVRLVRDI